MEGLLEQFGWDAEWARVFAATAAGHASSLVPGRIVRMAGNLPTVQLASRSLLARPSGRLRHRAAYAEELPTIGDWVAVAAPEGGGQALIHGVLPRRTALRRKEAGERVQAQVIAANVDVVFVVSALDTADNERRIERMLALTQTSGARPVMVLTKRDLCLDVPKAVADAEQLWAGAPVIAVDAKGGEGVDQVMAQLGPAETGVLIGASGVGKSTLANHLLGDARLVTGEVRDEDRKGRHTTTHRELFVLPGGGLLIDGPGMREFGLWDEAGTLAEGFEDVRVLAEQCRFSDCTHAQEPGCAIRAAVSSGAFDEARLHSFQKLQAEREQLLTHQDPALRREKKRQDRVLTKAASSASRSKKKGS